MAYKPPRDHAESIPMLKAEEERVTAADDRRGMFWVVASGHHRLGGIRFLRRASLIRSVFTRGGQRRGRSRLVTDGSVASFAAPALNTGAAASFATEEHIPRSKGGRQGGELARLGPSRWEV